MWKYIKIVLIVVIIASSVSAQPYSVGIGDSIFIPIVPDGINVLGYPDSIWFARYYTDSPLSKIEELTWKKADTLDPYYPIRKLIPGVFVWRGKASFASLGGKYLAVWFSFYGSNNDWGEYCYDVVPKDSLNLADAVAQLKRYIRYGTHWSPFGEKYGVESFSQRGNHLCSLYVFTRNDTAAVSKCDIKILNSAGNSTEGLWYTSSNGVAVFSLMNGGYIISPFKAGYSFEGIPFNLTIDGGPVCDTIWASKFDPGPSPSPDLCRVYGWVFGTGYDSLIGVTVQAKLKQMPVRYGSIVLSPYEKSTVTDSAGYWYLDLIPNEDIDPSNTKYQFTIYYSSGTVVRKEITVPKQSSWEFSW